KAAMQSSGIPQSPKPPARIVAPLGTSAMASAGLSKTLSMASASSAMEPLDVLHESAEEIPGIVRSGACFGMILNPERGGLRMGNSFAGRVIQVNVSDV